ncbi:hypothetical protein VNO77_16183 [Canavalia gladiata]|uniref:Uncharacterized protein n=1 Tax=Canavalia gladiata TaxID=3824 RepID=A0AAN9M5E4_CANGL
MTGNQCGMAERLCAVSNHKESLMRLKILKVVTLYDLLNRGIKRSKDAKTDDHITSSISDVYHSKTFTSHPSSMVLLLLGGALRNPIIPSIIIIIIFSHDPSNNNYLNKLSFSSLLFIFHYYISIAFSMHSSLVFCHCLITLFEPPQLKQLPLLHNPTFLLA